jgi:hypothetical protein
MAATAASPQWLLESNAVTARGKSERAMVGAEGFEPPTLSV